MNQRRQNVQIEGIGAAFPGATIDLEQTLAMVQTESAEVRALIRERISRHQGGRRRWAATQEDNRPMDWIRRATRQALTQAGCREEDIDMVLFCGVIKGFLEPSQAHICAQSLGIRSAHCVDVTEACTGFVRALEIADLYLSSGRARRTLIISALQNRFPCHDAAYAIRDTAELDYKLSQLTLGACATAVVVGAGHEADMDLRLFRVSDASSAEQCMVTTDFYQGFAADPKDPIYAAMAPGMFFAFGKPLYAEGRRLMRAVLERVHRPEAGVDLGRVLITHSASKSVYDEVLREYPVLLARHYNSFPWSGNVADNTVPVGLAALLAEERVAPGDRVSFLINGSGSSCVFATTAVLGGRRP